MSGNRRDNPPFANRGQQQPAQPRPKRQESPPEDATTDTIVGPQSYFTGTFRSEKDLRIEGTFEGEIDCRGTVIVAKDATLSATVRARNIEIAGSVTGDVFIEERLHLRTSGEMRGQSHAASFIVEEGGYFEGEMKMGATDQEDWPTIGNGTTSENVGLAIEPTQWSSKRSESRTNRPGGRPDRQWTRRYYEQPPSEHLRPLRKTNPVAHPPNRRPNRPPGPAAALPVRRAWCR